MSGREFIETVRDLSALRGRKKGRTGVGRPRGRPATKAGYKLFRYIKMEGKIADKRFCQPGRWGGAIICTREAGRIIGNPGKTGIRRKYNRLEVRDKGIRLPSAGMSLLRLQLLKRNTRSLSDASRFVRSAWL